MWIIRDGRLSNTEFIEMPEKPTSEPHPAAMWRIENGRLTTALIPGTEQMGAFCHCEKLTRVSIPESVKKIGRYAFKNTLLTSVRIADDCEYYPTSFPDSCMITGGPWDMLADCSGELVADVSGNQIYTRRI